MERSGPSSAPPQQLPAGHNGDPAVIPAALSALESLAVELRLFGIAGPKRRPVLLQAWAFAAGGETSLDAGISTLTPEERAVAEVGAIIVDAALEVEALKSGRPSPAGSRATGMFAGSWTWLCERVATCMKAAAGAGVPPPRCNAVQQLAFALLERYRGDLGGLTVPLEPLLSESQQLGNGACLKQADDQSIHLATTDSMPAKVRPQVWIQAKRGEKWDGPFMAREVLRMAEASALSFDTLICGLRKPLAKPSADEAEMLCQSFASLGALARRESELVAKQRALAGIADSFAYEKGGKGT